MDLSKVKIEELVYSADIMEQVETNLFTPILQTELCRKHGIPLKRQILLEGPYGTGKTMAANVTAKHAEANSWTFIYLDRVQSLDEAVIFARQYAPAVVFSEDIDRVMTGGRSIKVDDILNNVDGVDSKNSEVICVLTTNHVEKIEKAMLRPGRFDAVINVLPPDAAAAQKLMVQYGRGLLDTADLGEAGAELDGQIPAVIREAVERAKLYAIRRTAPGTDVTLTGSDVAAAARAMKYHMDLLKEKKEEPKSSAQIIGEALEETVTNVVKGNFKNTEKKVDELHNRIMH
jgi:transitional endoplasmic reticulum ATPase